jgi:DNA repair protein RadA/Sms
MQCGAWDSLVESAPITISNGKAKGSAVAAKPAKLTDIKSAKQPRMSTTIGEVDTVLGGGVVPGSLILLAGDPGIGKSTLVLQLAGLYSKQGKNILYVSGEESANQIKLRAERITGLRDTFDFVATTDLDSVISLVGAENYDLVIVDSIQTMSSSASASAAGTVSQITNGANALLQAAKQTNTAFILIGHVTKEGNLAGPRLLEHLVDVVLYLEGDRYGMLKFLRGVKNRFGATDEVGVLEMTDIGLQAVTNPSGLLLEERSLSPGSVVLATMEGSRPLLVEVQALVSPSVFGYPKRAGVGVDLNRLNMLCAVLTKRGGVNLSASDVYVNIVGGLKVTEPAIDLAIICALASAHKNVIINSNLVVFGEVGLSGEIRTVNNTERRLREAKKLGYKSALTAPNANLKGLKLPRTILEAVAFISKTK